MDNLTNQTPDEWMLSARACKALGAIVSVNTPGLIAAKIDLQPIQENDAYFLAALYTIRFVPCAYASPLSLLPTAILITVILF